MSARIGQLVVADRFTGEGEHSELEFAVTGHFGDELVTDLTRAEVFLLMSHLGRMLGLVVE